MCTHCVVHLTVEDTVHCPECHVHTANIAALPTNTALLSYLPKRKPLGEVSLTPTPQCTIHKKTLEAYCLEDTEVLCVVCVVENQHTSHRLMPIDAAADREREWLRGVLAQSETMERMVEKSEGDLDLAAATLKKGYEQAQSEVVGLYRAILETVKSRQSHKFANLLEIYTREKSNLSAKKAQSERQKELIAQLKAVCLPASRKDNIDLLRSSKIHKSLASQVFSKPCTPPAPFHFPVLQKETELNCLLGSLKVGINAKPFIPKPQEVALSLAQSHLLFSKNLRSNDKENVPKEAKRPGSCSRSRFPEKDCKPPCIPTIAISVDALSREFPLSSSRDREAVYSFGGVGVYTVERTEAGTLTSSLVTAMQGARAGFGLVPWEGAGVLAIGGSDSLQSEQAFLSVALSKQGTVRLTKSREGFGLSLAREKLYIYGGREAGVLTDRVEVYEDLAWKPVAKLKRPVAHFGYCSDSRDAVYLAGGVETEGVTSTVQTFDVQIVTVSPLSPLPAAKSSLALVYFQASIYAIGGSNGVSPLSSVDRLSLESSQWTSIAPLSSPRHSLSAVLSGSPPCLLCLGGFNTTALDLIEEFSFLSNCWRVAGRLATPRYQHASLVLPDNNT